MKCEILLTLDNVCSHLDSAVLLEEPTCVPDKIFLSIWSLAGTQDFIAPAPPKPQKRHTLISSIAKHNRPKTIFHKRIPGISPLFPSKSSSRILNKTPLNLLQNGPYYINHYIYCDNIDQHTIDQIKGGSFSSNKDIQHLNLHKDEFHQVGHNSGNKEFHVLHLPKDKTHDFNDVNLHLSLLNAHKSPELPEIDLELNKHVGNFEVNLGDIKPLDLDTSHLHSITPSSHHDIVKPLIQGQVSSGHNHKHNDNLIQLTDYLNENGHGGKGPFLQNFGSFESSHETNTQGEILDLPHFEQHPLENDHGKASYDTPGALDSYGHPATESAPPNSNLYFNTGDFPYGVGNGFKGNDLYQSEDYISQLNEINGLQRRRKMDAYISKRISEKPESEEEVKHLNHKYD